MERRIVTVQRSTPARLVPTGDPLTIPEDTFVTLTQNLGGTFTVIYDGNMARIDGADADALGLTPYVLSFDPPADGQIAKTQVDQALSSIYDPEIPVDIVALGLIYSIVINGDRVEITMTLTAPGCGMGEVLVQDVRDRVAKVPFVCQVDVDLVFDPPWSRDMMSDEAQLELGLF